MRPAAHTAVLQAPVPDVVGDPVEHDDDVASAGRTAAAPRPAASGSWGTVSASAPPGIGLAHSGSRPRQAGGRRGLQAALTAKTGKGCEHAGRTTQWPGGP